MSLTVFQCSSLDIHGPQVPPPVHEHYPQPVPHILPVPPIHHQQPVHVHPDYFTNAKYDFGYNIFDPHTGDIKNQHEHRTGDFVRGVYSFIESDGQRRVVEYSSDPYTGFNAIVRHEPLGQGLGHF